MGDLFIVRLAVSGIVVVVIAQGHVTLVRFLESVARDFN